MSILDNIIPPELSWWQIKAFVEHAIGFSPDALHVLAGVMLQIVAAALLRTSIQSIWPWIIVLVIELANEWYDLRAEAWPEPAMQWGEGAKDLLLTMALPTLLLILTRWTPDLFGPAKRRSKE